MFSLFKVVNTKIGAAPARGKENSMQPSRDNPYLNAPPAPTHKVAANLQSAYDRYGNEKQRAPAW